MGKKNSFSLILFLSFAAVSFSLWADIPPDTGLESRQEAALTEVAAGLVPERSYPGDDRGDCVVIGSDGFGLVAQLELNRRGLAGGVDPATAAPWAQYMAEAITRLVGTGGDLGVCAWENAGAPGIMNATAALAYAMHRYGEGWSSEVKQSIRAAVQDASWGDPGPYLANGRIAIVAGELLAGEALDLPDLWDQGAEHFNTIFDRTMRHGGIEMNSPLYTAHHFPILVFLQVLQDDVMRTRARILLEYELLIQAHLYLPGGGLGAPQSRDYSGGAADGGSQAMLPVIWLLIGDSQWEIDMASAYNYIVAAATDYVVPELIRSIFLDKADGYTFWAYTDAQQGSTRTPEAVYNLGMDGERAIPWQAVVLPGGSASLGVSYGYRLTALYVTSGVYTRIPAGGFAILYQYQPKVTTDTDDTGSTMGGSGLNDDPDDFTGELYDFERLVYKRTAITLWDPMARDGVARTYEDTRVHLPSYDVLGGETATDGGWRIGRLQDVYVAFLPLGTIAQEEVRGEGTDSYTYLRIDGPSGGIVELAATSQFASIDDYVADLTARHVDFTTDPLAAECDALDFETGDKVRIRLEYRPENRIIDGVEIPVEEALSHGLMESPWATWNEGSTVLRVARDCYAPIEYNWSGSTITLEDPPPECSAEPEPEMVVEETDTDAEPLPDSFVDAADIEDVAVDQEGDVDGGNGGEGEGCGCTIVV